jgi:predicted MPP superfamily phosphohydrolase
MQRQFIFPIVLISLLIFAEIASFLAFKIYLNSLSTVNVKRYIWIWWLVTSAIYIFSFSSRLIEHTFTKNLIVNIFFIFLITKLIIALVFVLFLLLNYFRSFFTSSKIENVAELLNSRRSFVSKVALSSALIPLATFSYGIIRTAYDFKIHRVKFKSPKISNAFKGFKIVQISDIHTGSLQGKYQLQKAVNLILELKPDLIVFTGDLVNSKTEEAFEFEDVLSQLKAPHGVYSTLGNHDYGDYHSWSSENEKEKNFEEMLHLHERVGWKLLNNQHVKIVKENDFFTLIGVENWGGNLNFKKYGDLSKAYQDMDENSLQILLSHDPSHWRMQVLQDYPKIDLTLSGHTHGFQFGVEIPGFKWSPSKYLYPQWAGLYHNEEQKLYVNRGLGCLGYMGRIGIKPEITLIEFS